MNMISSTKGRIESFSRKVSKRTRDIFGYLSLQKYKRRGLRQSDQPYPTPPPTFLIFSIAAIYLFLQSMGDLEDAFLKKNVPGRYSSWTEENDDDKQRNDDDDDENNDNDVSDSEDDEYYFEGLPTNNSPTSSSNMQQEEQQPQLRPSGNTGVKGVLADYREAKQQEQSMKEKERLDELEALYQATHPAMRRAEDCIISTNNNNDTNDRDNDSYDEDDDFLKRFRNQRLSELKQQQQQQRSTTSFPPKALFGSLTSVTPEEYVKLVDNMNNINIDDYYLIVHLYESSIQQCQILHSTLDKLASSWMEHHVQFIEVDALDANSNLDTICLPAILIYKRGELIHNMVRFTDDLPRGYDVEDVRKVLEKLVPFRE